MISKILKKAQIWFFTFLFLVNPFFINKALAIKTYNITIIGKFGSGKTSFTHCLIKGRSPAAPPASTDTAYASYFPLELAPDTPDPQKISVHISDTPGRDKVENQILRLRAGSANMVIIISDITEIQAGEGSSVFLSKLSGAFMEWCTKVHEQCPSARIVLVLNKYDKIQASHLDWVDTVRFNCRHFCTDPAIAGNTAIDVFFSCSRAFNNPDINFLIPVVLGGALQNLPQLPQDLTRMSPDVSLQNVFQGYLRRPSVINYLGLREAEIIVDKPDCPCAYEDCPNRIPQDHIDAHMDHLAYGNHGKVYCSPACKERDKKCTLL